MTASSFGALARESTKWSQSLSGSCNVHLKRLAPHIHSSRRKSERFDERTEGNSVLHVGLTPRGMRRYGNGQYGIHEFERREQHERQLDSHDDDADGHTDDDFHFSSQPEQQQRCDCHKPSVHDTNSLLRIGNLRKRSGDAEQRHEWIDDRFVRNDHSVGDDERAVRIHGHANGNDGHGKQRAYASGFDEQHEYRLGHLDDDWRDVRLQWIRKFHDDEDVAAR